MAERLWSKSSFSFDLMLNLLMGIKNKIGSVSIVGAGFTESCSIAMFRAILMFRSIIHVSGHAK